MHDSMVIILFFLSGIIIIIRRIIANSPNHKGSQGEHHVARKLSKFNRLDSTEYKVLNDVILRTSRGSSQIDHVVVSIYGIFVIETKNYSGWIHGNENAEYWTQTIYKTKNQLRNPIKQNWAHIYALKEFLSVYKQLKYYPIVVFTGSAELKNINSKIPVIYDNQLVQTILDMSHSVCLSIDQVDVIAARLNTAATPERPTMREHKRHVRDTIQDRKWKEKTLVCPRCGGDLILRSGRYGNFYGCSCYPKCKYTQKSN